MPIARALQHTIHSLGGQTLAKADGLRNKIAGFGVIHCFTVYETIYKVTPYDLVLVLLRLEIYERIATVDDGDLVARHRVSCQRSYGSAMGLEELSLHDYTHRRAYCVVNCRLSWQYSSSEMKYSLELKIFVDVKYLLE